jgi:hypothetical protein
VQQSACPALRVEMHPTKAHIIRFKPALDSSADLWPVVNKSVVGRYLHDSEGGEKSANLLRAKKTRQG